MRTLGILILAVGVAVVGPVSGEERPQAQKVKSSKSRLPSQPVSSSTYKETADVEIQLVLTSGPDMVKQVCGASPTTQCLAAQASFRDMAVSVRDKIVNLGAVKCLAKPDHTLLSGLNMMVDALNVLAVTQNVGALTQPSAEELIGAKRVSLARGAISQANCDEPDAEAPTRYPGDRGTGTGVDAEHRCPKLAEKLERGKPLNEWQEYYRWACQQ
jgi:hypothetical protein